jgi:hypothetical protein
VDERGVCGAGEPVVPETSVRTSSALVFSGRSARVPEVQPKLPQPNTVRPEVGFDPAGQVVRESPRVSR